MKLGIYLTKEQWEFVEGAIDTELNELNKMVGFWGENTKPAKRMQVDKEKLEEIAKIITEEMLRNEDTFLANDIDVSSELGFISPSESR